MGYTRKQKLERLKLIKKALSTQKGREALKVCCSSTVLRRQELGIEDEYGDPFTGYTPSAFLELLSDPFRDEELVRLMRKLNDEIAELEMSGEEDDE